MQKKKNKEPKSPASLWLITYSFRQGNLVCVIVFIAPKSKPVAKVMKVYWFVLT